MMRAFSTSFFGFLAMLSVVVPAPISAGGLKTEPSKGPTTSESVVKISAKAGKANAAGKQTVTVSLAMEKGWHIYANPIELKGFENNQTKVEVNTKVKPASVKVIYPPGMLFKDSEGDYKAYEDKVDINAVVERAKGDNSPMEVIISFVACSKNLCLSPATVKVKAEQ